MTASGRARGSGTASPGPAPVGRPDSLAARLAGLARTGFDRLLPPACIGCGRGLPPGSTPACAACLHRLPAVPHPRCRRCGATRPAGLTVPACFECESWPAELAVARAPFRMEAGAARLVHGLKYGGWTALAHPMAGRMVAEARRVAAALGEVACAHGVEPGSPALVPVPLSPARLRERGFNQAGLLARALAERTGWRFAPVLERRRTGRRQARLGRRERTRNVEGLFRAGERLPGAAILVDDVVTTGSTAAACAAALARAGTRPAGVVSFARAARALGDAGPTDRGAKHPAPARGPGGAAKASSRSHERSEVEA